MIDPDDRPSPTALVISALVFYGLMSVVGLAILATMNVSASALIFGTGETVAQDTLYGCVSGILVVGLTWMFRNLKTVKRLNDEFRSLLGSPPTSAITVLAITSAIGEEILFRGALQEFIGFYPTVVCFGLMHGGLSATYRAWAIFATLAGLLLGWLSLLTGNLLAPILCHMTVNYFNLHLVCGQTEAEKDI